jgi:hypothetical protein
MPETWRIACAFGKNASLAGGQDHAGMGSASTPANRSIHLTVPADGLHDRAIEFGCRV